MRLSFRPARCRRAPTYHARALAALLLLLALAGSGCSGDADFSDAMGEITTLSAEEYQAEIVELDRLVFDPAERTDARNAALEQKLEALAKRVRGEGDTTFLKLESLELKRLAAASDRMRPQDLQNQWMRIRNNLFDDRWWFARSPADLDAIVPPTPVPTEVAVEPSPRPAGAQDSTDREPPIAPSELPLTTPPEALVGSWLVIDITTNGRPNPDRELTGATLTVEGDRLTFESPASGTQAYRYAVVEDAAGYALRVESEKKGNESGWIIYDVTGGVLRIAFHDGLGKRPTGFASSERTQPELNVLRLARAK
jgi:uncharacterized protein (TIGR03067 family)